MRDSRRAMTCQDIWHATRSTPGPGAAGVASASEHFPAKHPPMGDAVCLPKNCSLVSEQKGKDCRDSKDYRTLSHRTSQYTSQILHNTSFSGCVMVFRGALVAPLHAFLETSSLVAHLLPMRRVHGNGLDTSIIGVNAARLHDGYFSSCSANKLQIVC